MNKMILYYALLSKRFFKKVSFVILLLSIPLLTAGLRIVSHQDSGMLKIILCAEDEEGNLALLTPEKDMPAGAEIG
jgi:hypothetical protein